MNATPIRAFALGGDVVIKVDAATARDISEAWATQYAVSEELEADRPWWMDDVIAIARAAALADLQAGNVPAPVLVPLRRVEGGVLK